MPRADFTYRDCDSYVILTPVSSRAIHRVAKLIETPLRPFGTGYVIDHENALVERHCLRQRGYVVESVA